MAEQEPRQDTPAPSHFGDPTPTPGRRNTLTRPAEMFPTGEDLPLFSGTPIPVIDRPYVPDDHTLKQAMLPNMPGIDLDVVLARDQELRRRRAPNPPLPPTGDIFTASPTTLPPQPAEVAHPPARPKRERRKPQPPEEGHLLREALAPYIDIPQLRYLAALGGDLSEAVTGSGDIPPDVQALLDVYTVLFRPTRKEQIKSPADVAALLMVEMSYLEQEQMRVVCLNTKNRLQKIHLVYQGSLNTAHIRVGEIFKEPLKLNSAAIILVHNHPSGEPVPSPEDVLVTREIVKAGELLDVECLDHLVIGQGRWVSLRERGLGFSKD